FPVADRHDERKKERGKRVKVDRKQYGEAQKRNEICKKHVSNRDRQDGEIGVVSAIRKEAVPPQHHDEPGHGHRQNNEKILVRNRRSIRIERLVPKPLHQSRVFVEQEYRSECARRRKDREHCPKTNAHSAFVFVFTGEEPLDEVAHENPKWISRST